MSDYRVVLAHVSDSAGVDKVLACAATVAKAQGASVHAIHAMEPLYMGVHLSPEAAMTAAQLGQEAEHKRVAVARERVLEAARDCGVPLEFHSTGGDPVDAINTHARAADLAVLAQPADNDPLGPSRRFASKLLVTANCPVLFVPSAGAVNSCGTNVLVAWSATRESARALRDALPILKKAKAVKVLRFGALDTGAQEPLDAVIAYLAAHGVTASGSVQPVRQVSFSERMLTPTVVDASIAELFLSQAADIGADLIVMGGYGHTRVYELALGGVTRTILGSMTVPVLMSH
jgi:nucleotide-binding universal stress UspA family protein